ncbi:MAG: OmpA family protein, partial [Bacteroidota bacterium]
RFPSKSAIDSIALSDNAKLLYVYQQPEHRVYNVRTGQQIVKFNMPVKIAFAHQDNYFVVSNSEWVTSFDSYTAEELEHYQIAADNAIEKMVISPDDAHIMALTNRKQIIFWKKGLEKPRKKFYGNDAVISADGKQFTITRVSGSTLSTFTYTLPEFGRLKKQSIDKILRDKAHDETLEIRKSDPAKRSAVIRASKFVNEGYELSNVGNYLAFFAETPEDEKELLILNTLTGEIILDDIVGTMKQSVALQWYNDSLMIPVNAQKAGVFNASQAKYDSQLELDFFPDGNRIKEKKLVQGRKISNDFKLSSLEEAGSLLLRGNRANDWQASIPGHQSLGFSPNSAYVFLENTADGRAGYIQTQDVLAGIKPEITYFSEQKRDYVEDVIKEDLSPAGVQYNRIQSFRHISEARPEDSLRIVMKTVEAGKNSGVQVQLIDKNGVYYFGAGSDDFKRIWCNLMVKGANGKVRQVDDFVVTENRNTDTLPNAISVVMDYSGSMGWARVDALQDGTEKLIKSKKEKDEIALVKYDNHVVLESKLNTNVPKLLRRLYQDDFSKFGGATALLDAINAGIFSVKNAENVGKKMVLIMTDGFENASLATRNEVLANALAGGVNLFTVGFGARVDDGYLKSLSYTTYGGHYHIYQTPDFDWVFTDIYQKATNYYTVNYESDGSESQVYLLKICLENGVADSMIVEYDNKPADIALLRANDANYKRNPVKKFGPAEIDTDDFDYPELTDYRKVKVRQPLQPKKFKLDEDRQTKIEDEFFQIELPRFNFYYDKTETVQQTEKRISELAQFLKRYPDIKLEIIGHTDNSGTLEYNEKLSKERADFVKNLITAKGIDGKRLATKGYGETSPLTDNTTEEGKARNRRVEFRILEEESGKRREERGKR